MEEDFNQVNLSEIKEVASNVYRCIINEESDSAF